ncbi:MAG: hypothetical protein AAGK23_00845 [Pseudomonadota bacterium]
MVKIAPALIAIAAFAGAPLAIADSAELPVKTSVEPSTNWYSNGPDVAYQPGEVTSYFGSANETTDTLTDQASQNFAERKHLQRQDFFDGYTTSAFDRNDLRIGTAEQFAEIGETYTSGPVYDPNFDRAVEGGNLFAKAKVDWRNIF